MRKRVVLKNTSIFEKGQSPSYFYLIRSGSVVYATVDQEGNKHPFMEVDSYFGEFELFGEDKSRVWTVMAKTNIIVYTLKRTKFVQLFSDYQLREAFLKAMNERLYNFHKVEREIGRAIRRIQRVRKKEEK